MPAALRRLLAPGFALLLLLGLMQAGARSVLFNQGIDLLFHLRGPLPQDQRIVIVGVDDASLAELGQWPFPRQLHGALLGRLQGAAAVGFDFLFPEPAAGDESLNAALAAGPPAILAVAPSGQGGLLRPNPGLTGQAGLGHIVTRLSGDGIVRQAPLAPQEDVPAFSIALARAAGQEVRSAEAGLRVINFHGPEASFLTLSYKDVLAGIYPPQLFKDRFIMVGPQALGMGDSWITSFTRQMPTPGIEIQATILSNLLDDAFITPLPWLPWAIIDLFALLPVFVWPRGSERRNLALNLALMLAVAAAAYLLFRRNFFFDYLSPLIFLTSAWLFYLFQELFNAAGQILRQTRAIDRQLDERLELAYGGGPADAEAAGGRALLSPSGIRRHLDRLQQAADALALQHHFLDNLLNRELPPLILWESERGRPVLANAAFRDFWRAVCESGEEAETALPEYAAFVRKVKDLPEDAEIAEIPLERFDLRVKMPAGRRDLQGSVHDLTLPNTGFSGKLALLQDITEIKELERVKDEVVSIVSHELKQPLTVILGYGQMLAEDLEGPSLTFAQKICHQAERLHRMIRDFLDIARLESGRQQLKREPFPLERMVGEVLETIQTSAKKKDIKVRRVAPDSTTPYNGDEALLVHALLNLLDNAVKFSKPNTVVELRLFEEPDRFILQVADQGPGIPDEERERVFGKFQRGSRTAKDEGFGLGLHLVHQIIEGHGGTIEALAVPVGATFEIVLPKG